MGKKQPAGGEAEVREHHARFWDSDQLNGAWCDVAKETVGTLVLRASTIANRQGTISTPPLRSGQSAGIQSRLPCEPPEGGSPEPKARAKARTTNPEYCVRPQEKEGHGLHQRASLPAWIGGRADARSVQQLESAGGLLRDECGSRERDSDDERQ